MRYVAILLLFSVVGCTTWTGAVNVVNPLRFVQTGVYPLIIIAELETSFSSLLIDKTKAKVENLSVSPYEILPEGSSIYVMPILFHINGKKSYDTYYSNMFNNYLRLNNLAKPIKNVELADYVIMTEITESPERTIGANFSTLKVTIMEQNENPVFFSTVKVVSKSDSNFYYYPAKSARPVKELTLIGLEELFEKAIPVAFGEKQVGG